MLFAVFSICLSFMAVSFSFLPRGSGSTRVCDSEECLPYDLSSESSCVYETHDATYIPDWYAGLDANIDLALAGGKIAAYRIFWWGGFWSSWYVPGVNDLDWKFNTDTMAPRRVWSYFFDHSHEYIICRSPTAEPTVTPSAAPSRKPTQKPTTKPTTRSNGAGSNGIPTEDSASPSSGSVGLSGAAIAGIVIGSVAGMILAFVGGYYYSSYWNRLERNHKHRPLSTLAEVEDLPM